jgi:hypothetical protein
MTGVVSGPLSVVRFAEDPASLDTLALLTTNNGQLTTDH